MTSTETKHTPGPWLMADKPSSVVGWPVVQQGTGRAICTLNYIQHTQIDPKVPGDRAFNAESRANGQVIEASPDLLAACKLLLKARVPHPSGDGYAYGLGVLHEACVAAEAAIAKAEGK